MKLLRIDLNLDAGESTEALEDGHEAALYNLVSSLNVACGGHAGDESTMSKVAELAAERGLAIGAHPGFPDRKSFGRRAMNIGHGALVDSLCAQIESLAAVLKRNGLRMSHIKPHGALYNLAATDRAYASAVIEAARRVDRQLPVVGLAGSHFIRWCQLAEQAVVGEGFADRRYEADGTLRSRQFADALVTDPSEAGDQALQLALSGSAETICVHGDSPGALALAKAVRENLLRAGVRILPLDRS